MPCSRTLTFPLSYISGQKVQGHRDTFSIYSTSFLLMYCKWGSCNIISHIPFSFFVFTVTSESFHVRDHGLFWISLVKWMLQQNVIGQKKTNSMSKKYFLNLYQQPRGLCLLAQWWMSLRGNQNKRFQTKN